MNKNILPKLDLTTFILSVASAAFRELSANPVGLEVARQNIDLLELMQEKTKGNLSVDEAKLLEQLLYESRIRFMTATKE